MGVLSYPSLPLGRYSCSYPFFLLNHVPSNISFTPFLPGKNVSLSLKIKTQIISHSPLAVTSL